MWHPEISYIFYSGSPDNIFRIIVCGNIYVHNYIATIHISLSINNDSISGILKTLSSFVTFSFLFIYLNSCIG